MKYLHIDSQSRAKKDSKSNFTVHVPSEFKNCTRVAVKSLSIPNTFANLTPQTTFAWAEIFNTKVNLSGPWEGCIFEANIQTQIDENGHHIKRKTYMDNAELQTLLSEVLTGDKYIIKRTQFRIIIDPVTSNHKVYSTEGAISNRININTNNQNYDVNYNVNYSTSDFKFTIDAKALTKTHLFMPFCYNNEESLWHNMGFEKNKIVNTATLENLILDLDSVGTKANARSYNDSKAMYVREINRNEDNVNSILTGDHVSNHENHIREINICSSILSSDSFVTIDGGQVVGTNILETITNTASKFSYIHYVSDQLFYHKLSKNISNTFDIQLLDSSYRFIHPEACPDFKIVLVFESRDEIEYDKEFLKEYARIGYNIAHQ